MKFVALLLVGIATLTIATMASPTSENSSEQSYPDPCGLKPHVKDLCAAKDLTIHQCVPCLIAKCHHVVEANQTDCLGIKGCIDGVDLTACPSTIPNGN